MKVIRLKPGKERSGLRGHPWVYDSAVAKGKADSGETVRVESDNGQFIGWGAYSPQSKIRVRIWSFDEATRIDAAYFEARIQSSVATRSRLSVQSDGVRLLHGEADGVPGLIVDQYHDTLVAQFLSAGVQRWKVEISDALLRATGLEKLYERSDASSRKLEGLPEESGWLRGFGPTQLVIREHDWNLQLDIASGHKTGFYLDQRDNRAVFAHFTKHRRFERVLNCYCYTGGFTVAGLKAGAAHITSVDSSALALDQARANLALNAIDAARAEFLDADVNATLRAFIKSGKSFDAIILDPPKFAPSAAHAERAARAYKDINRLAFKLLEPGGLLFTFSCSGGVDADLFHKIVASAGIDAGVDGYILQRLGAAPDHPMTIRFPEGEYLKGLVVMKR